MSSRDGVEVFHTRVFAATPTGGNPCPVVPSADGLSDTDMLRAARRFGLDTAFILPPQHAQADLRVRYFVPDHEMEVSGHATIAALTVALHTGAISGQSVRVETKSGIFAVAWERHEGEVLTLLEQRAPFFGGTHDFDHSALTLGLQDDDLDLTRSPIETVSVSRPKLLIPLRNSDILDRVAPNYGRLWKLCETAQVTGLYPFTRSTKRTHVDVEARQFPYRAGFPEDAATGVAAAALAAYLTRYDRHCSSGEHVLRIAQGYAIGAPSLIEGVVVCSQQRITKTAVRGSAKIVGHEQIALAE